MKRSMRLWLLLLLCVPLVLAQVQTFQRVRLGGGASGKLAEVDSSGNLLVTLNGTASAVADTGVTSFPRLRVAGGATGNLAEVDSSGQLLVNCTNCSTATAGNPTATISGTAVNGSASTYMRSDAAPALGTAAKTRSFGAFFDGNGVALTTGNSLPFQVPFACTISGYSISVAAADTATFKLWRKATGTAIPTVADVINTAGVSLAANTHVRSTTVSDFTSTAISANDIIIVQLSAVGGTTTGATFTVECTL